MYDDRRISNSQNVRTPTTDTPTHPSRDEIALAAVLHALSDPVRLLMVRGLAGALEGRSCGSFDVPVTKSTCTHHFKVLREAGIIQQRQEGTKRVNTLRDDDLEARFPGLLATILEAAGDQPELTART
jgi:DNA-binding transcriptional ArsR family regulator